MTSAQAITGLWNQRAGATTMPRMFIILAGLTMALGTVVLFEPAPYDAALILLAFSGVVLNRLSFTITHRIPFLLLAIYFVSNGVSLFAVQDYPIATQYIAITIYLVLSWILFVGLSGSHGASGVNVLMTGYAAAGWFSALAASLAFLHLVPYEDILLRFGRAQGFFKDPNVYGPYLVPVLLYGLMTLQRLRPASIAFWLSIAGCVVTATGIFLSFSRAAWINTVVSVVFFLGLQLVHGMVTRKISPTMLISLLAVPILAGGVILVSLTASASFSHMLNDRLGYGGLHGYDTMRFYTQRRAYETVLVQPLGIGPGQAEVRFDYSTHNMYIRVLVESGFFGFIAFYLFVILSLLRATKFALILRDGLSRDLFAIISASILGTMINGTVIDTIHWRHFWFFLGLAWWVPKMNLSRKAAQ